MPAKQFAPNTFTKHIDSPVHRASEIRTGKYVRNVLAPPVLHLQLKADHYSPMFAAMSPLFLRAVSLWSVSAIGCERSRQQGDRQLAAGCQHPSIQSPYPRSQYPNPISRT